MHDELKIFSPAMLTLLKAAVEDAVQYCTDIAGDCGDDLEAVAHVMNPKAVYEASIQMFANLICPDFTFEATAVPESVKLALRRIVMIEVQLAM